MTDPEALWIGNQTAWSAPRLLDPFEYALASGFTAFEWFPDKKPFGGWDEADLDEPLRFRLRQLAQQAGMRVSVHARWTADPLRAELAPVLLTDLELAQSLGAQLLNVHLFSESGMAAYAQAILPLLRRATAAGMQVAIENTPETTPQQFNELFAILLDLDRGIARYAGMCLDLGHANLCAATHNNYLGYLDQLGPHVPILHLHLHENWGDADTHLPLFTGPAGLDESGIAGVLGRLRARHYSGSMILEQWPEPPSQLNVARDRLRELWRRWVLEKAPGDGRTRCWGADSQARAK